MCDNGIFIQWALLIESLDWHNKIRENTLPGRHNICAFMHKTIHRFRPPQIASATICFNRLLTVRYFRLFTREGDIECAGCGNTEHWGLKDRVLPWLPSCPCRLARGKAWGSMFSLWWKLKTVVGKHPDLLVGPPTATVFPTNDQNFEISQFFAKNFEKV